MATCDNLVINPLLCFCTNRMSVLPRSIINRIVVENFCEDITTAKDVLYSNVSVPPKQRRIKRLVQQICDIFWPNCGFDDNSMKFGTQLEHTTRKIFGHRAIAYLSHGSCGSHFTKWQPEFTIFAHKLNCIDYGWCRTHSSGSMYHLLLTGHAWASHGLEHNYVW